MEIGAIYRCKNECIVNGKRTTYNGCSDRDLDEAKDFYKEYEYIGSGFITFHDGVKNTWEKLHHFFIRKY